MPLKVLVADDDPDILEFYRLSLADHYELLYARDGEEAWKLVQEKRPRAVVTDLNMPGINGQDLTQKIRGHEELSDTPIIVLTGTTRDSDLPPGFWRIGTSANAFLEKPISPDDLLNEVRRQLVLSMNVAPLPPGKGYY